MNKLEKLRELEAEGTCYTVALLGAGYVAGGVIDIIEATPGFRVVLVINRTTEKAVKLLESKGVEAPDIVCSDDVADLKAALESGKTAVSSEYSVVSQLGVDVFIEATGAIDYGTSAILHCLDSGIDVLSYNAEADSLFGFEFARRAAKQGCVYSIADGDQPGVQLRLKQECELMGFDVTAMYNCKRYLDVHQSPDSGSQYSARDMTSAVMTTSFGDGTKMQIEQCVVANICNFKPLKRGMVGVETTLEEAPATLPAALGSEVGVVEYTLAGDFGAGVGVVGRHRQAERHKRALGLYKMGDGPDYFFFKPFHLVHLELPQTLFDLVVSRSSLGNVTEPNVTQVIAVAKKALAAEEKLDCIGGFSAYGHIASAADSEGLLPICLVEYARMLKPVKKDAPIPLSAVELDTSIAAVKLWLTHQHEWQRNTAFLKNTA